MFVPSPSLIPVYDLRRQELLAEAARYRFEAACSDRGGEPQEVAGSRFARALACALTALSSIAIGLHIT